MKSGIYYLGWETQAIKYLEPSKTPDGNLLSNLTF
jgi:hypothetical protein